MHVLLSKVPPGSEGRTTFHLSLSVFIWLFGSSVWMSGSASLWKQWWTYFNEVSTLKSREWFKSGFWNSTDLHQSVSSTQGGRTENYDAGITQVDFAISPALWNFIILGGGNQDKYGTETIPVAFGSLENPNSGIIRIHIRILEMV